MAKDIDWKMLFSGDLETENEKADPDEKTETAERTERNPINIIRYEINTINTVKEDLDLLFPGGFSIDYIKNILDDLCFEDREVQEITESDVSNILGLAISQGELYTNMLCYLDFLYKKQKDDDIIFLFTTRFWQYKKLPSIERNISLFKSMIEHDTIKNCFYYCNRWSYVEKYKEIIEVLSYDPNIRTWDEELHNIGRNARCVKNWYRWVEQNIRD